MFCPCPARCIEGLESFCASIPSPTDLSTYHSGFAVPPFGTESPQVVSGGKEEEGLGNKTHQPFLEEGEEDL